MNIQFIIFLFPDFAAINCASGTTFADAYFMARNCLADIIAVYIQNETTLPRKVLKKIKNVPKDCFILPITVRF